MSLFSSAYTKRVNVIIVMSLVAFLLVIVRLFSIQIFYAKEYKELAEKQHWRSENLDAERGVIYASDGYPLADVQITYLVYAQPKVLDQPEKIAKALVEVLEINELNEKKLDTDEYKLQKVILEERYLERLTLDLYWVIIKSGVSREQKQELEKRGFAGLGFEEEFTRFYPEDRLASHILGFVGRGEQGESQGYFGIEGYYDGDLRGRSGVKNEERDAQGKLILLGDERLEPAKNGRNIYLSVDRVIQSIAENSIKQGVEDFDAKNGSVIIINPKTGEILAIANYPNFDPSDLSEKVCDKEGEGLVIDEEEKEDIDCEKEERRNLAVSDIYEPGSVIKPLTISIALDLGLVTPQTTINDQGPIYASTHKVDNWNFEHHGVINMTQILELSNNIGAATVAKKVGSQDLYEYFEKFNLNLPTGIDLEGESSGYMRDLSKWREIDLVTASFGQGIATTPIQVLGAFVAIANEGVYIKPRVVNKIIDESGQEFNIESKQVRQVIKKSTADLMVDMLTQAMKDGLGKNYFTSRYKIAGKTGTAQIPVEGKYDPSKTNTTFVAFLPTTRDFVMLVKYEEPKTSIYANQNAVVTWFDIADKLVDYLEIEPDL